MVKPKEPAPKGLLIVRVRPGNSLSEAPWVKADSKALQTTGDEGVSGLQVVVSIAERLPDEPSDDGQVPEWGTWGPSLREISVWLPTVQDKKILAQVLIYCWSVCSGLETAPVQEVLSDLSRVAAAKGLVRLSDGIRETKKSNKGGRPRGSVNKDTTAWYLKLFKRFKDAGPSSSDSVLLDKVVTATTRNSWGAEKKASHRAKVRKALQRAGCLPRQRKKKLRTLT